MRLMPSLASHNWSMQLLATLTSQRSISVNEMPISLEKKALLRSLAQWSTFPALMFRVRSRLYHSDLWHESRKAAALEAEQRLWLKAVWLREMRSWVRTKSFFRLLQLFLISIRRPSSSPNHRTTQRREASSHDQKASRKCTLPTI